MPLMVVAGLLVLATVASVFFNSYILFLSCTQNFRQTRTTTHILLLHLGVINLLIAALFLIGFFPSLIQVEWLGSGGCSAVGSAWFTLHVAAIWTLTALNVDKYVAIASPLHYARFVSLGRVGVTVAVSWVLSAGLCTLPLLLPGLHSTSRPPGCCLPDVVSASPLLGRSYALALSLFGYILPALLVTSANGRILVIARHHRHRIVSALWDVTVSAQATVTPQRSHFYLTRYRGRSAATTVFHFVGTFIILYLPSAVCLLYEALARSYVPVNVSITNFALLTFAPAINGFVYGVKSKVLRKNFKNFLRKRLYRSEVNYEIQSRAPSVPASRRPSVTPSLSLPLQQKLQRRMSEILIQPTTSTPSEGGTKLVRRSSELCFRPRGSNSSIPRDTTPSRPMVDSSMLLVNNTNQTDQQNNQVKNEQVKPDKTKGGSQEKVNTSPPKSPLSRSSKVFRLLSQSNSLEENQHPETETSNNTSTVMTNHRPSLRRALFARNKQKSLDFEMTCLYLEESSSDSVIHPPRSASQQIVGDLGSPSLARPLLLDPRSQPPLSPARKTKRVSWSSDSFSDSPMDSDNDTVIVSNPVPPRYRKKTMFRNNGLRFDFSKVSLERIDSEDVRQSLEHSDSLDSSPPISPQIAANNKTEVDVHPVNSPVVANGKVISKSNGHHDIAGAVALPTHNT
ncbi:5-hydroxytryptamine receptor 6-like [Homarus americanus]|uniref:5-hydroxytryptamine receptor 6-like n=1 Tax=Homarus americanus TaxID=6706 RepID=UPI001C478634|nr:5-hydroxytryptamine receptor 6-like [Homarus americanus]